MVLQHRSREQRNLERSDSVVRFGLSLMVIILAVISFSVTACAKQEEELQLKLPETPQLSERDLWAVVSVPYLRIRGSSEDTSETIGMMRKGSVAEVLAISQRLYEMNDTRDYWYLVENDEVKGWVFGDSIELFETREKAVRAAELE